MDLNQAYADGYTQILYMNLFTFRSILEASYDIKPDGGGGGGKKMLRHPSPEAGKWKRMTLTNRETERGEDMTLSIVK